MPSRRSVAVHRKRTLRHDVSASAPAIWQTRIERFAMRGRRPKPTRLKMLTGNPGKRPLNGNEPRPAAAVPECPAELGTLARTEWNRLVGELAALRLLTNLDRAALAAYSGAYALWAE